MVNEFERIIGIRDSAEGDLPDPAEEKRVTVPDEPVEDPNSDTPTEVTTERGTETPDERTTETVTETPVTEGDSGEDSSESAV